MSCVPSSSAVTNVPLKMKFAVRPVSGVSEETAYLVDSSSSLIMDAISSTPDGTAMVVCNLKALVYT